MMLMLACAVAGLTHKALLVRTTLITSLLAVSSVVVNVVLELTCLLTLLINHS